MWKGDAKKTRVTSRGTPRDSEVWPDASSQFPVRYFARQNLSNIAASSLASRTNRESSVAGFLLPLCHAVALCRTWYALRPPTHKVESRREYKITLSLSLSLRGPFGNITREFGKWILSRSILLNFLTLEKLCLVLETGRRRCGRLYGGNYEPKIIFNTWKCPFQRTLCLTAKN